MSSLRLPDRRWQNELRGAVLTNTSGIPMFDTGHPMSQVERKANEREDFHRPGETLPMSSACTKATVSAA
jgi:hypothetical protein